MINPVIQSHYRSRSRRRSLRRWLKNVALNPPPCSTNALTLAAAPLQAVLAISSAASRARSFSASAARTSVQSVRRSPPRWPSCRCGC